LKAQSVKSSTGFYFDGFDEGGFVKCLQSDIYLFTGENGDLFGCKDFMFWLEKPHFARLTSCWI